MTTNNRKKSEAFDPKDEGSWNFGPLSRQESVELLKKDKEDGVFLIRESQSHHGNHVLSVRQGEKIRHYEIFRKENRGRLEYTIGEQTFPDLPTLLDFYKTHYLENSALTHPAPSKAIKTLPAKAIVLRTRIPNKYDSEQLPLYAGNVVTVTKMNPNGQWEGELEDGRKGSFPFTHVQFVDDM